MSVTMPLLSHKKCPCCWNCKETVKLLIETNGTVPSIDGIWDTSINSALAAWAVPTHTARGLGGHQRIYATSVFSPVATCSWQAAQYCIADPGGYRGRSWVVELFIRNNTTGVVTTMTDVVQDWTCGCNGPDYQWSVEGDFGCLDDPVVDPTCPCAGLCLSVTLPPINFTFSGVTCTACNYPGETFIGKKVNTPGLCLWQNASGTPSDFNMVYNEFLPGANKWRLQLVARGPGPCSKTVNYEGPNCTGTFTRRLPSGCPGPDFPNTVTVTEVDCP